MKRLTVNKDTKDMTMVELAHNCCYVKDGEAWYRDYDKDISARDFIRRNTDFGRKEKKAFWQVRNCSKMKHSTTP